MYELKIIHTLVFFFLVLYKNKGLPEKKMTLTFNSRREANRAG